MEIQTTLSIAIIVVLVIIFGIWLFWQIKKKGLKGFATDMIIKAEEMYNKGKNQEKMNYVIDKVIAMLPKPLQFFITKEAVRKFVQSVFDSIKNALDYVPKNK